MDVYTVLQILLLFCGILLLTIAIIVTFVFIGIEPPIMQRVLYNLPLRRITYFDVTIYNARRYVKRFFVENKGQNELIIGKGKFLIPENYKPIDAGKKPKATRLDFDLTQPNPLDNNAEGFSIYKPFTYDISPVTPEEFIKIRAKEAAQDILHENVTLQEMIAEHAGLIIGVIGAVLIIYMLPTILMAFKG